MALADVYVAGIRVPAGSIFGIQWKDDRTPDAEVVGIDAIEGVTFLRPTMFSLPPEERERVFNLDSRAQASLGRKWIEKIKRVTLDDFRALARRQVAMRGRESRPATPAADLRYTDNRSAPPLLQRASSESALGPSPRMA